MPIGRNNVRFAIQGNQGTARDAAGQITPSWTTVAYRWGALAMQSGRDYVAARQAQVEHTGSVEFHQPYAGLTTRHRLVNGSRTFHVTSVTDPDARGRKQVVMVKEIG